MDVISLCIKDRGVSVRRHCSDLVSIYQNDLPYWYRLNLESKKEQPLEAPSFRCALLTHANRNMRCDKQMKLNVCYALNAPS